MLKQAWTCFDLSRGCHKSRRKRSERLREVLVCGFPKHAGQNWAQQVTCMTSDGLPKSLTHLRTNIVQGFVRLSSVLVGMLSSWQCARFMGVQRAPRMMFVVILLLLLLHYFVYSFSLPYPFEKGKAPRSLWRSKGLDFIVTPKDFTEFKSLLFMWLAESDLLWLFSTILWLKNSGSSGSGNSSLIAKERRLRWNIALPSKKVVGLVSALPRFPGNLQLINKGPRLRSKAFSDLVRTCN